MVVLPRKVSGGRKEVVVFTRQYHELSSLLHPPIAASAEAPLTVHDRSVSLQPSGVRPPNETGPEIHLKITRAKETGKVQLDRRRIFAAYHGNTPLYLHLLSSGKQLKPTVVFGLTPLTTDFSKKLKFCSARIACNNKETGRSLTKIMFMLARGR